MYRPMDSDKVVVGKMEGDCRLKIIEFLAERIGQACQSAARHAERQILALNMGCRNQVRIGVPNNFPALSGNHFGRAIPTRTDWLGFVGLYNLAIVNA